MTNVLEVADLNIAFRQDGRSIAAVRGVSFTVAKGETVALVGESGSGKSVTALSTVGLLPDSATVTGSVRYLGREMVGASPVSYTHLDVYKRQIMTNTTTPKPCRPMPWAKPASGGMTRTRRQSSRQRAC